MKASPRFILLLLLVAGGLGIALWFWNGPGARVHRVDMLGPWGMGRDLAARYPGSRVLIISNPFTQHADVPKAILRQEESRVEGLRTGLEEGGMAVEVVYPALKLGALEDPRSFIADSDTSTPLSFLVAENAFDQLREPHPDADLMVSLIGIPADLTQGKAWNDPSGPRFAFFLPDLKLLGGRPGVEAAFAADKLAAVVLTRPGSAAEDAEVGRLDDATFSEQFLLVHRDNAAAVMSKWGSLFSR